MTCLRSRSNTDCKKMMEMQDLRLGSLALLGLRARDGQIPIPFCASKFAGWLEASWE